MTEVLTVKSRISWLAVGAVVAVVAILGIGRLTRPDSDSARASDGRSSHAAVVVPSTSAGSGTPGPSGTTAPSVAHSGTTYHYISNSGRNIGPVARLGFNLFDMGPDKGRIDSLGSGQKALVWLGNLDNTSCTPGYSWSEFTAAVRRLANDPKVFGYYLSDEPHPNVCPNAAAHIRQRADYIRDHDPSQKSFIVVMDASRNCGVDLGCEYRLLRPEITHVDLIGVDPFPCRIGTGCAPDKIDLEVSRAIGGGIPIDKIVPVYQVFGQECSHKATKYYAQPSTTQLQTMMDQWADLVPNPAFDMSYTWRSEGPACPGLDVASGGAHPDLQATVKQHNEG